MNKSAFLLLSVSILSCTAASPVRSAPVTGTYGQLKIAATSYGKEFAAASGLPAALAVSPAASYTSAQADRLAAMAAKGPAQEYFVNGGMDRQDQYYYSGVPTAVRRVNPRDVGIMRHWTSNAQAGGVPVVELIVRSGLLKAGTRPYILPQSHRADYYTDLHGVFFTTPGFPPQDLLMGLGPESDYVDFTVEPGMGALYLAPGNYLFPCPLTVNKWIADQYLKWKNTGVMPAGMENTFKSIDRQGGLGQALDIPIKILSYQQNGRITVIQR